MKKLALFALVLVGAALAISYATTGKIALLPGSAASGEEGDLLALEGRFLAAKREFAQASRSAALGGLDPTGGIESARAEVEALLGEVAALKRRLESDPLRARADRLERDLREFRSRLG